MKIFTQKCYDYLTNYVPKGFVISYGDLAKSIGHKGAAQSVGTAMKTNPYAPKVPCHRVIKSDGSIGKYLYGQAEKIKLLKQEGVKIIGTKVDEKHILKLHTFDKNNRSLK